MDRKVLEGLASTSAIIWSRVLWLHSFTIGWAAIGLSVSACICAGVLELRVLQKCLATRLLRVQAGQLLRKNGEKRDGAPREAIRVLGRSNVGGRHSYR